MNGLDLLTQAAWKGTLVLSAGFVTALVLRRASAALRHYLWTTVFVALLVLPVAMSVGPRWTPPAAVMVSQSAAPVTSIAVANSAPASTPVPWLWIYAAGVLATAIRFIAGAVRTQSLLAGGERINRFGMPRGVHVIESAAVPVPLVWGLLRPTIVLPVAARTWQRTRLRTVLLHELIHVQRRDLLAQVAGQLACCLYWFHPLAWLAARQLRKERELACDDAVLRRGIAAPEYAGHLVDLVRGMNIAAPAMASASDFEARVRALLNRGQNRAPLTRRVALAGAAIACALILPVASVTSHAQAGRGELTGTVTDPSGARVPGATINAKNLDAGSEETTTSDPAGQFVFHAVPAGRYEVLVLARGFKVRKQELVVTNGTTATTSPALGVGDQTETVRIVGSRNPAPATQAVRPQRIPVGGNVQPSKLLRQLKPVYPPELLAQGLTGTVVMRAIIGKDGRVINPQVINTDIHPAFAKAALEAVQQWLYTPSLLNGMPIETMTKIDLTFEMEK